MKIKTRSLLLFQCVFLTQCVNINGPVVPAVSPQKVVVELLMKAPTFARAGSDRGFWLSEIRPAVAMSMMVSLGEPIPDQPARDTVIQDVQISMTLGRRQPLFQFMDGIWMWMNPDTATYLLDLRLEDASVNPASDAEGTPILYSNLMVRFKRGDSLVASVLLQPLLDDQGMTYGANAALPLGASVYSAEVSASAPEATARDSGYQDYLRNTMTASFPDLIVGSVPSSSQQVGNVTLPGGIGVGMAVAPPETLWLWNAASGTVVATPPGNGSTVFIRVSLRDLNAQGPGRPLAYTQAQCRLFSEDGADSTAWAELVPVQSSTGFRYVVNTALPGKGGGHGDGHAH